MAVAPVVVDPDRPELAHATRARFVEATSWCIACRRATSARLLRAPLKWLHEPDFCGPCGRPQDEHAAVFFTEAWRALLVGAEPGRLIESNVITSLNPGSAVPRNQSID